MAGPAVAVRPPLGAHVSIADGIDGAPARGARVGADAIQIFTSAPRRWAPRPLSEQEAASFAEERDGHGIRFVAAHDGYLINLASADPALRARSLEAFRAELARCRRLGADVLVSHPGHAGADHREAALRRNAAALAAALEAEPGPTRVLLETTAGSGTALGWRFEELAELLARLPAGARERVGVCLDTAHVFAAGYDLGGRYEDTLSTFDAVLGLDRLELLHLNDSRSERGSRVDRHEEIGLGRIGDGPFRSIMRDPRLARVPRVLETPKGEEPVAADRRNLRRLRELAGWERASSPDAGSDPSPGPASDLRSDAVPDPS